ncbi:MAG: PilZ domain-containing protein [Alphaproteobacteria bacterium]|nr:PilZ domain-containing protein [Alphaproteobacteria bacterium]TAD87265.1 MAG: PilZ domain-containing protein [Alphaproteobacteria bacterium]
MSDTRQALALDLLGTVRASRLGGASARPIAGAPRLRVQLPHGVFDTLDWSLGGMRLRMPAPPAPEGTEVPMRIAIPGRVLTAVGMVVRYDAQERAAQFRFTRLDQESLTELARIARA